MSATPSTPSGRQPAALSSRHVVTVRWADLPPFLIQVHPGWDRYISTSIRRTGAWDPVESWCMTRLLSPGDIVVDVGANIGWHSLIAAGCVGPSGRVVAVEPDPANSTLLRSNCLRNRFHQVEVHEVAASDNDDVGQLYRSPDNLGDQRIFSSQGVSDPVTVQRRRLDGLLAEIPPVDLVKIDTQGAECRVLDGMFGRLRVDRPILVLEFWPKGLRAAGNSVTGLAQRIRALHVACFVVDRNGGCLRPIFLRQLHDLADSLRDGHHSDLLLVPFERVGELPMVELLAGVPEAFLEGQSVLS